MNRRRQMGTYAVIGAITGLLILVESPFASIWPSLAALVLVFLTRNVLAGLFGGALIGSILICGGRFWLAPMNLVEVHLLPNFGSSWKSGAIIFTLLLGGFVQLLERGGVLQSLLTRLLHGESRRKVETGAALFGLVCFFDGLANSLMVGRLFKKMADGAGVTRVRLAYIVDTTSAAVACLAFVSTWIAYQLAMIREGFLLSGKAELAEPYHLFFASIPHNYYAWFALLLMGMVIWKGWNIGAMRQFPSKPLPSSSDKSGAEARAGGLWRAALPVAVLLGTVFFGIYLDGTGRMGETRWPVSLDKLALSFSEANVPVILIIASAGGALLAWALFPRGVLMDEESCGTVFMEGMIQLMKPVLILVAAWMLSSTLKELKAADVIGELLEGRIALRFFPLAVFLTGSLISFTTGTSWGTMGLLMPLAIPVVFSLSGPDAEMAFRMLPMVVGAVFSGAVFGDHCSPISDTTIVSSIACGVDPVDHVRTQLPYALLAAAGAALLGFLGVGFAGGSPWLAPFAGLVFLGFITALISFYHRNAGNA